MTTIEEGFSPTTIWIMIILTLALIAGTVLAVVPDRLKRDEQLANYCDRYSATPRNIIPAKCVRYFER